MARDDYYTIVAKILVYLYKRYKRIEQNENFIAPYTDNFPISDGQLRDTIDMMEGQGFIKGEIIRNHDNEVVYVEYQSLKITPAGIDHLQDDSKIRKICTGLKEAAAIMGFFV